MIHGKEELKSLSPYQQGKQTEDIKATYGLTEIIKLASNENPYGASPRVKDSLTNLIQHTHIYPDGYARTLREQLSNKFEVNEQNLVFGSGSDELIQLISLAFLSPESHTIMAKQTFSQYKHNATIAGAETEEVDTINGVHDLKGMRNAIREQTKIIWICNPNNPSGTIVSKESFTSFMEKCPADVLVVLDEAYYEFMNKTYELHAIQLIDTYPNLLVLRTFSKAYGLAGLRVAYGIGHEDVIKQLDIVRGPFNTNAFAQQAASIAATDESFLRHVEQSNREVRTSFASFLDSIGWSYLPSETNFLLVQTPVSGHEVFDYLIQRGVIIRPGELLGYPNTIRISIGLADEMEKVKQVITQFNEQMSKEI